MKSLPGATCYLVGKRPAHGDRTTNSFLIPASGDNNSVRAGAVGDGSQTPWPASSTGPGYSITATCSLTGKPTTTSAAITVVWP